MTGCLKWVIIIWSVLIVGTFFVGAANVGELMDKGQTSETAGGFAVMFSILIHSMIWAAVVIPAYLFMKIFGRKETAKESRLCSACGKYHDSEGKFCPNCGASI